MALLQEIVDFLDATLRTAEIEDFPSARNGLQLEMRDSVVRICAAVDASATALEEASLVNGSLLLVHHGLLWEGPRPFTGTLMRKLRRAIESNTGIYSSHLPLDVHPSLGNNALLAKAMGLEPTEPAFPFKGTPVGCIADCNLAPQNLLERLALATGSAARMTGSGPERIHRVAIVTGSGSNEMETAATLGCHAIVTGEAPHHRCVAAAELGLHLFLGGHYETEVFGVCAVAREAASRFEIPFHWIEAPPFLAPG